MLIWFRFYSFYRVENVESKKIFYSCSIEENLWAPEPAVVNRVLWLNSTFCVCIMELSNDNSDNIENATKQKV